VNEAAYREAEERWWAHQGATPNEHRLHLRRLAVDVRVQEVGNGPAVLFLHGGPNSGSTWAQVASRLQGHIRCLLVDRPGTGLSDPLPEPVGPDRLRAFAETLVVDVLDAMDLERVHVVASSFGGMIALYSAAAHPDRFDRMVQMACPAMAPGMRTPPFMRMMMAPGLGRLIMALPPNQRAGRSILRQIGHGASLDAGRIDPAFEDWYLELQRHTDTMANDGKMIAGFGSLRGFDRRLTIPDEVLAAVATPTYLLWGEDDTFGGAEVARHLADALPDATLELLPGAGHLPWIDDPDHAARVVTTFLVGSKDRIPQPPG
jgi:2-hydroxy-6-oxonona-2,4-dienedioate hydrolase